MTGENNGVETPSYLSKDFFKKSLENGFKSKNIQVDSLVITMGSGGGDNYTSNIYRVLVKYKMADGKPKEISLIIKDIQTEGESREALNIMDVYNIEKNMYLETVPLMENLIGNNVMLAPKCFNVLEAQKVFVFQDLKALGFDIADRLKGLDVKHSELVLKKIGQFHAASMVLAKTNPEYVKRFDKGMFNDHLIDSQLFKDLFVANLEGMINVVETWPDYEAITAKLKKISVNFRERCSDIMKPKEGELRVLNHGDLWVNNIMFKYDSNKVPCDAAFVDLQISNYGSLGIDINYFLNMSLQLNVLKTNRYELLKVYYHSLKKTLETLNYSPVPTWDDVRREIRAKEFYGLSCFAGVLPIILINREASKDSSIEAFADETKSKEKRDAMFSSERLLETMKYTLNRFDELGVLDS